MVTEKTYFSYIFWESSTNKPNTTILRVLSTFYQHSLQILLWLWMDLIPAVTEIILRSYVNSYLTQQILSWKLFQDKQIIICGALHELCRTIILTNLHYLLYGRYLFHLIQDIMIVPCRIVTLYHNILVCHYNILVWFTYQPPYSINCSAVSDQYRVAKFSKNPSSVTLSQEVQSCWHTVM